MGSGMVGSSVRDRRRRMAATARNGAVDMSIVIVGAGPNLGLAIARRFGSAGLAAGLVSRNQGKLDGLVEQLEADGIQASGAAADIRDPDALTRAIGALADRLGAVEVLEYSPLPAPEFMKPIL